MLSDYLKNKKNRAETFRCLKENLLKISYLIDDLGFVEILYKYYNSYGSC